MKPNILAKKIGFYAIIIIAWQGLDSAEIWPDKIFPSPVDVAEDLAYGIADASLFYGIGTSLLRLIVGLSIAIAGGLVLGLQSIPSIAWVPLAILWFGLTDTGIIFVVAIGAISVSYTHLTLPTSDLV